LENYPYLHDPWPYRLRECPAAYDSCDWRFMPGRRGPYPPFWEYVCHSACHWLVNLNLFLAMEVQPSKPWRIVSSSRHSTVWDGESTLWDANYLALGVEASEAWKLAAEGEDSLILCPGQFMLHELPDDLPPAFYSRLGKDEPVSRST